jgi:hypothetical protein
MALGLGSPGNQRREAMKALGRIAVGIILGTSALVRAQSEEPEAEVRIAPPPEITTAVRDGALLPSTLTPRVGATAALAFGFAGYDGARSAPLGSATAEVRVWGPFALRGGAEYSSVRKEARPTIGGRVQLLHQERHGVDGSLGVFYRPEGFTEPEGEIETFVSLGRRFERITVLGNLVYGQDPEGNERDGELRFASLYAAGRWAFGVDSRLRFAIGTQKSAMAQAEPRFDVMAGPIATAAVGPVAFFAQAGPSVLKVTGSTSAGVAALGGVGSVF